MFKGLQLRMPRAVLTILFRCYNRLQHMKARISITYYNIITNYECHDCGLFRFSL